MYKTKMLGRTLLHHAARTDILRTTSKPARGPLSIIISELFERCELNDGIHTEREPSTNARAKPVEELYSGHTVNCCIAIERKNKTDTKLAVRNEGTAAFPFSIQ
jgi:hypothetical protein